MLRMKRKDSGAVLVIVLLVVVVLLGLGMAGLYMTTETVRMAANINLSNSARIVAEAGVERARSLLYDGVQPLPLPALLAGSGNSADEVPNDTSKCLGERRGAILVDFQTNQPLFHVSYPSFSRQVDLPTKTGAVSVKLGTYTVYVRQDLAECRIGNFTCDSTAPDAGDSPYGATKCTPTGGLPAPNGYVVVRSEGLAVDGRSLEVIEQTFYIGHQVSSSTGGTGGGTGGTGGMGSATEGLGTGGLGGTGGSGGSGGTGGLGGTGGTGGTSSSDLCLNYAVTAVAPCPNGYTPGCITINSGTKIDSFNSSQGSYGSGNNRSASVAMTCSKSAASSSCPDNCPTGCITGSVDYSYTSNFSASTLPAPSYTSNATQLSVPPNLTIQPSTPSTVTYYDEVSLNSGGTLTLNAGRYVANRLNLNNNSTLYIDDTKGSVTLWVLSAFSPSSSVVVKSGNPNNFWLVYNGTGQINNNTNNLFTGVIFAPAAEVNLNYVVTGAVVGGKVTLNSNATVHFDTNLLCP